MSETYIHHDSRGHHDPYRNVNNSHFHELQQTNAILMDWLVGTMTVLIVTYALILCYYFKILQTVCKRGLRKHGKMITLGELSSKQPPLERDNTPLSNQTQV